MTVGVQIATDRQTDPRRMYPNPRPSHSRSQVGVGVLTVGVQIATDRHIAFNLTLVHVHVIVDLGSRLRVQIATDRQTDTHRM